MVYTPSNTRDLAFPDLEGNLICRSVIIRYNPTWFADTMENNKVNDSQIINVMKASVAKARAAYKPARVCIIIETNSIYDGILAYFCQTEEIVAVQINPIGKTRLDELGERERVECFRKRLRGWLADYHVVSRNVASFSPNKPINVNEL